MSATRTGSILGVALAAAALASGCGSNNSSSGGSGGTGGGGGTTASSGGTSQGGAAAPGGQAPSEAQSAATGDIPDNQVFLTYRNAPHGYSLKYPEGWARKGSASDVTFTNKANVIEVVVSKGPPPTTATALAGLSKLRHADPSIKPGKPQALRIGGAPVVKVTYTRLSQADPVTGKRLPLTIDRYEYAQAGKVAIVDLGTSQGVDNVDAYRMISQSFRWR